MRVLRRWGRKRRGLTQRTQGTRSSQRKAEEADPSAARPDAPNGGAENLSRAALVGLTGLCKLVDEQGKGRLGSQREEEPKTQAQTPCLGHPVSGNRGDTSPREG